MCTVCGVPLELRLFLFELESHFVSRGGPRHSPFWSPRAQEVITVAEKVAKGFWVIEVYYVGIVPPILPAEGVDVVVVAHRSP